MRNNEMDDKKKRPAFAENMSAAQRRRNRVKRNNRIVLVGSGCYVGNIHGTSYSRSIILKVCCKIICNNICHL